MAKILISFLGTGGLIQKTEDPKTVHEPREYRAAEYRMGDDSLGEHSFLSLALKQHTNADSIILIGTPHSMWDALYLKLNDGKDDDIYYEIADACEKASHDSQLKIPHQKLLEEKLGKNSHIILIKYGINENELNENIEKVLEINQFIHDRDELIVDVTHGFRSLPILIMQLLFYLQTVSNKHINISHIYYGMLEAALELKYAPVVDLKRTLDISQWITAADEFKNFGNAHQISKLLEGEDKEAAQRLAKFSDLMNLNHLCGIRSAAQDLAAIKDRQYDSILPNMVVTPIVKEFYNKFHNVEPLSLFELRLAEWQMQHHNYTAAYLTVTEAIVTNVCERTKNLDPDIKEDREAAKDLLKKLDRLSPIYHKVVGRRNDLAHARDTSKSADSMIRTLKESINQLKEKIK